MEGNLPKTKRNEDKLLIDYREDARWKVYAHINTINGKMYIGITNQKNINCRWRNGKGYKHNIHFTRAIEKYGWDNFQHVIIANSLTEDEAKKFEIRLITKLGTKNQDKGYNISAGGDGVTGISRFGKDNPFYGKHHSEEQRKKWSEMRKGLMAGDKNPFYGKHLPEETRKKLSDSRSKNQIYQLDMNLNFVKEYKNSVEAEKETGIWQSQILGCCEKTNGYKTAGGYVWVFKKDFDTLYKDECLKRINHEKLPKPIMQFSLNMDFIGEYKSIADAAKAVNTDSCNISVAANGKSLQSNGYIWIFKSDYEKMKNGEIPMRKPYKEPFKKPVCQFSKDGKFIKEYKSRIDASKAVGVTPQAISCCCNGKTSQSGGYIWRHSKDCKLCDDGFYIMQ